MELGEKLKEIEIIFGGFLKKNIKIDSLKIEK